MDDASRLSVGQAGLRFLIELGALAAWGIAGWRMTDSAARWLLVIAIPVAGAAAWATFRVPGDASAGGGAPIPVSGPVRLVLEVALLLGAAVALATAWRPAVGWVYAAVVAAHYLMTIRRTRWLLSAPPPRR
jgi:hypothetical protein